MHDRVLGLDGYKKRWLGVTLLDGRFHSASVFGTIAQARLAWATAMGGRPITKPSGSSVAVAAACF